MIQKSLSERLAKLQPVTEVSNPFVPTTTFQHLHPQRNPRLVNSLVASLMHFTYDSPGELTKIEDALGKQIAIEYFHRV